MPVDAVLFHGNSEHLRSGCTVNVFPVRKDLLAPGFSCHPGNYPGFNGREIGNDELLSFRCYESGADKLRKRVRNIFVQQFDGFPVSGAYKCPGLGQVGEVILRQVLHLNQPSRPSAGAVGSVKLEHPSGASVRTHGVLHCLILFDRRFGKLLPEEKHLAQAFRCSFEQFGNGLFPECVRMQPVGGKPCFHL